MKEGDSEADKDMTKKDKYTKEKKCLRVSTYVAYRSMKYSAVRLE